MYNYNGNKNNVVTMATKRNTCIFFLIIIGTTPAKGALSTSFILPETSTVFLSALTDPTNINCTAVNSTALQVTWDQATDAAVLGYYLHIERVDGLRIEPDIPSVDLNAKTFDNYEFAGLGKYGTYSITINSYTSTSNLTAHVETCTTAEDIPDGAPLTFDCIGISVNVISCSWSSLGQVYWNGVPQGYKVIWLSLNVSLMYQKTVDANTTSTLVTGLEAGAKYTVLLNPYTSVGDGTMYSTTTAATRALSAEEAENVTRYYCNEAVPGMIEFAWEEMPCTIYSGTIGGLLVLCGAFLCIICCMSCCGKTSSNNLSLNLFEDSGIRRRKRTDDIDSDGDNYYDDDMETDGKNDGNLYDEDYEEHEEGFENKGYKSDEDPDSDNGTETNTPYQSSKSPRDKADKALHKNGSALKGTTCATDGRLTATDIKLEPIDEDVISTDDDAQDSDYDTQSDYDDNGNELSSYDNKVRIRKALADKSGGQTSKNSAYVKNIATNGNTRIKAKFPVEKKTIASVVSTSVAEIHRTESDVNTQTPENIFHDEMKNNKDNQNFNNLNDDTDIDERGSPIQKHQETVKLRSDWNITDKEVDSQLFKKNLEKSKTTEIRNINFKKGNPLLSITLNKREPKVKVSDAPLFFNQDAKTSKDVSRKASARKHGGPIRNKEIDIELDSWATPIFENKKLDTDMSNGGTLHFNVEREGTSDEKTLSANDWGDDNGWGDLFSKENDRRSHSKHNFQTTNGLSKKETDLSMFQTYDGKTWNADNLELTHENEITSEQNNRHVMVNKPNKQALIKRSSVTTTSINAEQTDKPVNIFLSYEKVRKLNAVETSSSTTKVLEKTKETKKISFRDHQTETQKLKVANAETKKTEPINHFFIEDEIDQVKLSNEEIQRPRTDQNGKNISTRAWLPKSNNQTARPDRKTPVKSLPKVQSRTSIEVQPILGSDRLGKKFPFLNFDNTSPDSVTKGNNWTEELRLKRNKSYSDLVKQINVQDESSDDTVKAKVLSKFQKAKQSSSEQVFYGFGMGKFRKVAATWLAKVRFKKNPTLTAQSDWR